MRKDLYVMQMTGGDYFVLACPHKPDTKRSMEIRDMQTGKLVEIRGGSYTVAFGPCSETEADEYIHQARRKQ